MRRRTVLFGAVGVVVGILAAQWLGLGRAPTHSAKGVTTPPIAAGAGDIAASGGAQGATAQRLAGASFVFTLGDNAYEDGTLGQYQSYYQPSWGAYKGITRPSAGNHDYHTGGAAGFKSYFGRSTTYYSWTAPGWRFYALDSNIARGVGSAQYNWLKSQLVANSLPCIAAYWHHPRFSSGEHGNNTSVGSFWTLLYAAHADLILNGHDHDYERFAPQTPTGAGGDAGIREIIAGTGGKSLRGFNTTKPNSLVRLRSYGVLRLTLKPGGYDWKQVSTTGSTLDSGSDTCH